MLRTFADYATDTGQRWQPVMNILRRNNGTLKVVLADEMYDRRSVWCNGNVRAEISITVLVRDRMLLREAMWTLEEISTAVQVRNNEPSPVTSMSVSCRGKLYVVRLLGIPKKLAASYYKKDLGNMKPERLRRAQQNVADDRYLDRPMIETCSCDQYKIGRDVREARASLNKDFLKRWRGREPKRAKQVDTTCHGECTKTWSEGRSNGLDTSKTNLQLRVMKAAVEKKTMVMVRIGLGSTVKVKEFTGRSAMFEHECGWGSNAHQVK